jgi:hypothetical protein
MRKGGRRWPRLRQRRRRHRPVSPSATPDGVPRGRYPDLQAEGDRPVAFPCMKRRLQVFVQAPCSGAYGRRRSRVGGRGPGPGEPERDASDPVSGEGARRFGVDPAAALGPGERATASGRLSVFAIHGTVAWCRDGPHPCDGMRPAYRCGGSAGFPPASRLTFPCRSFGPAQRFRLGVAGEDVASEAPRGSAHHKTRSAKGQAAAPVSQDSSSWVTNR